MTTADLIQILTNITQENIDNVKKFTTKLSDDQMKWRPNPGIWSVGEVLAHLNEYAVYYHPTIASKIKTTRFTSTKEEFMSSPLGRSAWKSMKLGKVKNVKRKFRAPKGQNPTLHPELVKGTEVADFLKHQADMMELIEQSQTVNLRRVKIPISISKIVRLRLGDALLFVVYHNQRHVQQIINLVTHKNFPKK
ncbi:MAG: hypothetical protein DCO96_14025 [Fluviicola sp. XM-24bin1]|nr:MAG: hypothetical protein DCO96_14025 [Fluviicola sp. XM-24bin1]